MKSLRKLDFLFILFLLLAAGGFSYLFYADMNKQLEESTEAEIGTVSFKMNTLQKRPGARMVYKDVYESFPLNNKDTIRTYEGSDAVITFKDGTKVKLDENSLIYFDQESGKPNIKFEEGSIQLESNNSNLSITSDGKKIDMNKGDFKLNKESKGLEFIVNKGDASIKDSSGKEVKIKESQMASLGEKGVSVKELPFQLISPIDQYKELTFTQVNIHFAWKSKKSVEERYLEISKNKDFSNIVHNSKVVSSTSVSLKPGSYFWRLKQKEDSNFEFSETRKINIIQDSEIKPFTPLENAKFPKSISSVTFSWSKHPLSSNFKIYISKDAKLSNIFKEISLTSTQLLVQDLPIGSYFWKVAALPSMENAAPIYSNVREFSILDVDVVKEEPVEDAKEIIEKSMVPNHEKIVIETKKPITFQWKEVTGTDYYEFKMYNEIQNKGNPIFKTKSKNNMVVFNNYSYLDEGKFFWEVNPVDTMGRKGQPAKGTFEINIEDKLKNIKPDDIKIISPDTIYRVENE